MINNSSILFVLAALPAVPSFFMDLSTLPGWTQTLRLAAVLGLGAAGLAAWAYESYKGRSKW